MIEFKPLAIEDRAVIEAYTLKHAPANCDLAFANMFCWQFQYQTAWAEVDGFLVIRFLIDGGQRIGYMQPVGEGDFTSVLRQLEEDVREQGQRLRLIGLTREGVACLRRARIGAFACSSDRRQEDYVYRVEDLRELEGSRYKSKRNHVNRFEAEYTHHYEPLTAEHMEECMELEQQWRTTRLALEGGELSAEQRAMQRAFDHFDTLGLRGGAIYVSGRMAAFTYGSAINSRTFCIHVEKADTAFDGAFTAINKLFLRHLPSEFELVNREEDMGLDGLRQAKLSYHPLFLQEKYTALKLHEDELQCKRLFIEAFTPELDALDAREAVEAEADSFIVQHYSRHNMLGLYDEALEDGTPKIERSGRRLVSMLHLIPMQTEFGPTTYIYAVATDRAYRGRGLASSLMTEAMRTIEARGDAAAFLIPSTPALEAFYAPFGLAPAGLPVHFEAHDGFDFGTGDPTLDRAMIWRRDPSTPLPEVLHAKKANP